jgi:hypothetical protein
MDGEVPWQSGQLVGFLTLEKVTIYPEDLSPFRHLMIMGRTRRETPALEAEHRKSGRPIKPNRNVTGPDWI